MSNRDGVVIDFSNYKDRFSAHLPEGEYLVRVVDADLTETKKGDPMVELFYEVVGGDQAGQPLVDRLTLTDRALFRAVATLRALGFKVEKRKMRFPFDNIIGRTMLVKVSDGEPYNDEVRSEIRSYAPAPAKGAAKPVAKEEPVEEEIAEVEEEKVDEAPWEDAEDATEAKFDIPDEDVKL